MCGSPSLPAGCRHRPRSEPRLLWPFALPTLPGLEGEVYSVGIEKGGNDGHDNAQGYDDHNPRLLHNDHGPVATTEGRELERGGLVHTVMTPIDFPLGLEVSCSRESMPPTGLGNCRSLVTKPVGFETPEEVTLSVSSSVDQNVALFW